LYSQIITYRPRSAQSKEQQFLDCLILGTFEDLLVTVKFHYSNNFPSPNNTLFHNTLFLSSGCEMKNNKNHFFSHFFIDT
jgi:hypothetical protein